MSDTNCIPQLSPESRSQLVYVMKSADPERPEPDYDPDIPYSGINKSDPWKPALFEYARGALWVADLAPVLTPIWRSKGDLTKSQWQLVRWLVIDWWWHYHECDLQHMHVDHNAAMLEFVKALRRVDKPGPNSMLDYAISQAEASFNGPHPDPRAVRMIKILVIKKPQFRHFTHILYKLSDQYPGQPFPLVQRAISLATGLGQKEISRYILKLRGDCALELVRESDHKKRQCALYQIPDRLYVPARQSPKLSLKDVSPKVGR